MLSIVWDGEWIPGSWGCPCLGSVLITSPDPGRQQWEFMLCITEFENNS